MNRGRRGLASRRSLGLGGRRDPDQCLNQAFRRAQLFGWPSMIGTTNRRTERGTEMASTKAGTAWVIRHCSITANRRLDTRLAAVPESKPSADEVPLEAWWHLVESLRHSIPVRRTREGVVILDAGILRRETYQAAWCAAQAALAHLGEGPSKWTPTGCVRTTRRDRGLKWRVARIRPVGPAAAGPPRPRPSLPFALL
jgi:hypothetical protein